MLLIQIPILEIILGAAAFIANTFLGLSVFIKNPKSWTNKLFAILVVVLDAYILINPISLHPPTPTPEKQLFWIRLVMFIAAFMGPLLFLLVHTFPRKEIVLKKKYLIGILAIMTLTAIFAIATPLVFESLSFPGGEPVPKAGLAMPFFLIDFAGFILLAFICLVQKYRKAVSEEKAKLLYFLIGIVITFTFMALGTVISVVFLKTSATIYLGPIFPVILMSFTAYSIMKYRFLDIQPLIVRAVSFIGVIGFFAIFYSFVLLVLVSRITPINANLLVIFLLLMAITTLTFQPLAGYIRKITNKLFFKARYDTEELLGTLTKIMASTIDLDSMADQILAVMVKEMNLTKAALLFIENHIITDLKSVGFHDHQLVSADFEKTIFHRGVPIKIILDELEEGPEKELLRKFDVSAALPLNTENKEIAILILGPKASGEPYFKQDLTFLDILAPQAAVAIQNALAFKQLLKLDEAKSEFITVISHQLRNPLSVARWNTELVLEGIHGKIKNKETRSALETAYEGISRLNEGLNNLITALEIAEKNIILQKKKFDLMKEVIVSVQKEFAGKLRTKNIKLAIQGKFSDYEIEADFNKIHFAFKALLSNAILYSPPKGKIVVIAEKNNEELKVAIEDEGIGVAQENRENIFGKFFRGEQARIMSPDGLGLSLFISRAFIEAHGGKLWLEEKEDKTKSGARFCFTIPLK